ncbi:Uncharacterised protein [Serratia odorifera]|jgi:hypothetical protein|uniref:Uncharacterized protein n=3 Tax=Serratia odorifera TaxID=618 RepID=D4DXP0_SEROD|nr:hypothetical protein [Serratia odorifera]EFE97783.1 hypothetical protein HMPREF0758_0690 [Serratia odorifera DSM 4582]PNK92130.1 hypothetical protein CEQ31_021915 [Serratia odorifera]RII73527.1 hypothetical protein DX901_04585 [Serratia odorifera]VDZ53179.1 Uncharacterised protein [Serratia odorifera]
MRIFPELYGFVIFSEQPLLSFIKENGIEKDLLAFMTTNDEADKLTEAGIIVPIFDVSEGLYEVSLQCSTLAKNISKLGMFKSEGKLSICGMGYLADFDVEALRNREKIQDFSVPQGVFELFCAIDESNQKISLILD